MTAASRRQRGHDTEPRTWDIRLPWTLPPLSMNDRTHWRVRARKVADTRAATFALVNRRLPIFAPDHVAVTLTYYPRDSRRRDADNLVATLKAVCDAIVDARIVPDDTPRYMTKHMPVIAEPDGDPRLVLTITEVLT